MTLVLTVLGAAAILLLPMGPAVGVWFGAAILGGAMKRPYWPHFSPVRAALRDTGAVLRVVFRGG